MGALREFREWGTLSIYYTLYAFIYAFLVFSFLSKFNMAPVSFMLCILYICFFFFGVSLFKEV